jgi:hypothetical protein
MACVGGIFLRRLSSSFVCNADTAAPAHCAPEVNMEFPRVGTVRGIALRRQLELEVEIFSSIPAMTQ